MTDDTRNIIIGILGLVCISMLLFAIYDISSPDVQYEPTHYHVITYRSGDEFNVVYTAWRPIISKDKQVLIIRRDLTLLVISPSDIIHATTVEVME